MQNKLKKIVAIMFICIAIFSLFPKKAHALPDGVGTNLSTSQKREVIEKSFIKVATEVINVAGQKGADILEYGTSRKMIKWVKEDGKLKADCGDFVASIYRIIFGDTQLLDVYEENDNRGAQNEEGYGTIRQAYKADKIRGFERYIISYTSLRPGDILKTETSVRGERHVAIYLGDIYGDGIEYVAESGGISEKHKMGINTLKAENGKDRFYYAFRLTDNHINNLFQNADINVFIDWAAVGINYSSPNTIDNINVSPNAFSSASILGSSAGASDFIYNGLAVRVQNANVQTAPILNKLTEGIDYLIGVSTLAVKIQLIGWTSIFEEMITGVVESITSEPTYADSLETVKTEETTISSPETTKLSATEAGNVIANYAVDLVLNHQSEFVYSYGNGKYDSYYLDENGKRVSGSEQAYIGKKVSGIAKGTGSNYRESTKPEMSFQNKYSVDCAGFVNMVIHQSLGIGGDTYTSFAGSAMFNKVGTSAETLQSGDIIEWNGHWAIYVGNNEIAHAVNKTTNASEEWTIYKDELSSQKKNEIKSVYRITESTAATIDPSKVNSNFRTSLAYGDDFKLSRNIEPNKLTIEKIVYNKVPILDVNLFNFNNAADLELTTDSVIYILKENVANWYSIFRNITIVGLLIVLLYIGIRMALSTIAAEKAKYSKIFVNWLISFIIVFFIHYYMLAAILINEYLVDFVSKAGFEVVETVEMLKLVEETDDEGNTTKILKKVRAEITTETSLYNSIFEKAYEIKASQGVAGTIMYMFLVYYLVKFLFVYFKRLLTVYILALISPLIAISYAIDKIKDGKSQALGLWMKEFAENVLIQFVHAILYLIFVKMAFEMVSSEGLGGVIIGFVFLSFMLKAESILFKLFKFGGKTGSLKNLLDSTGQAIAGYQTVKFYAGNYIGLHKGVAMKAAGAVKAISKTESYKGMVARMQKSRAENKYFVGENGKVSPFVTNNMLLSFAPEDYKKAAKDARKAKWKAMKGSLDSGRKIVTKYAQFGLSIPQVIANPSQGISNLIRTSLELKRLLEDPDKVKLGGKYAGKRLSLIKRGGKVALGVMTGGTIYMGNVRKRQNKEIKKVDEKYIIASAYKEALDIEKRIASEVMAKGKIDPKYVKMIKAGVSSKAITIDMLEDMKSRSFDSIEEMINATYYSLKSQDVEVSRKDIEKSMRQIVLNSLAEASQTATTHIGEEILKLSKERAEKLREQRKKIKAAIEKDPNKIKLGPVSSLQAVSLARYQKLYNDTFEKMKVIRGEDAAEAEAQRKLDLESTKIEVELKEAEAELRRLRGRISVEDINEFDTQRQEMLQERISRLKIEQEMIDSIRRVRVAHEKVTVIDDDLAEELIEIDEKTKGIENGNKAKVRSIGQDRIKDFSSTQVSELAYKVWKSDRVLSRSRISLREIEEATNLYINGHEEEEITEATVTAIVEHIREVKGISRSKYEIEKTVTQELLEDSQSIINGEAQRTEKIDALHDEYGFKLSRSETRDIRATISEEALKKIREALVKINSPPDVKAGRLENEVGKEKIDLLIKEVTEVLSADSLVALMYASVQRDRLPAEYEDLSAYINRLNEINRYTKAKTGKTVCNTNNLFENALSTFSR